MAGIIATSATKTMVAGDTSVTDSETGYLKNEKISLSTSPTGSTYAWVLTKPSGSASLISSATAAAPSFVPDVEGLFIVKCTVDSTTVYTITLTILDVAIANSVQAFRLQQLLDSKIPTPSAAIAQILWLSDSHGGMLSKNSSGNVRPLGSLGSVGAALTDADAAAVVGDGVIRVLPLSTLTVNRTLTINTTSAETGDIIEIVRLDVEAFTYAIVNGGPGAGTLTTLPVSEKRAARLKFDGTNWTLHELIRL